MLEENYQLVKMAEAFGLEDDPTPPIRNILVGLKPDVVAGIRRAVVKMPDGTQYIMPIDCNVTEQQLDPGTRVDVEILPQGGVPTIHVRALKAST